jgi:hypothetical protein
MNMDTNDLEKAIEEYGEIFVVLESGAEYIIHGKNGYELEWGVLTVEGIKDGEYLIAQFPIEAVEHFYTHREL